MLKDDSNKKQQWLSYYQENFTNFIRDYKEYNNLSIHRFQQISGVGRGVIDRLLTNDQYELKLEVMVNLTVAIDVSLIDAISYDSKRDYLRLIAK